MSTRGGQPGNQNAAKSRMFSQALQRAIARDDHARINQAAEKLLDLAASGEQWAVKELADRLDGKSPQGMIVGGDPDNPLVTVSKIERVIVDPKNA